MLIENLLCKNFKNANTKLIHKLEESMLVNSELKNINDELLGCIDKINRIAKQGKIIENVTRTKFGEYLVCYSTTLPNDFEWEHYQYFIETLYTGKVLSLFLQVDLKASTIEIIDIQNSQATSQGYGSIAMAQIFYLVDKYKINKINGTQYSEDENNKKRQISFYKKFQFRIINSSLIWERNVDKHPFSLEGTR